MISLGYENCHNLTGKIFINKPVYYCGDYDNSVRCSIYTTGIEHIFKSLEEAKKYYNMEEKELKIQIPEGYEGCYFRECLCGESIHITGSCCSRKDETSVMFKEVKEEVKEIILPDGFVVDKIENGKIILKSSSTDDLNCWEKCAKYLKEKEYLEYITTNSEVQHLKGFYDIDEYDFNLLPEGYGKIILALFQLLICRNAWWKKANWKPNWSDGKLKYCITHINNKLSRWNTLYNSHVLAFPTREMRDEFCSTFKDLIEQAKDLL